MRAAQTSAGNTHPGLTNSLDLRKEKAVPYPTQPQERWLPVVGYEGIYEVSDAGSVRSLDRVGVRGHRYRGRPLAPAVGVNGYPAVSLRDHYGRKLTRTVHRMVVEAFCGPIPEGLEVRHRNGIRTDSRLRNLHLGTRSENMLDRRDHGTCPQSNRTECPRGHALIAPNLVRSKWAAGVRQCRACHRESASARSQGRPFNPEMSDARYADIMHEH